LDQVNVETMDRYTIRRAKSGWAWIKEVELLRQFFEFCRDREWTGKNPARSLKRPRMIEANHVVPYTKQEVIAIIAACDQMGRTSYERRRARAMTLLMRYAGLRISDVVTLSRDHIRGTRLEKRAIKNHQTIRVELPSAVVEALEVLPHPKGAADDNRRFFSKDTANLRSLVKGAWRSMSAVFRQAGVKAAHPHRFRHTLASELLGKGRNPWGSSSHPGGQRRYDQSLLCEVDTGVSRPARRINPENPWHKSDTDRRTGS